MLFLGFAVNNNHEVILRIVPGFSQYVLIGPLVLWLFIAFLCGIMLTVVGLLPVILRGLKSNKSNAS